ASGRSGAPGARAGPLSAETKELVGSAACLAPRSRRLRMMPIAADPESQRGTPSPQSPLPARPDRAACGGFDGPIARRDQASAVAATLRGLTSASALVL